MHLLLRVLRTLLLGTGVSLFAASCAAVGSGLPKDEAETHAIQVRFTDFKSGQVLSIVNDRWLVVQGITGENFSARRTAFYSQATSKLGAGVKVAKIATMQGLLEFMDLEDFSKFADHGAPQADTNLRQSIEIARNGQIRHIRGQIGLGKQRKDAFSAIRAGFVDIYNRVPQYQTVQGSLEFKGLGN